MGPPSPCLWRTDHCRRQRFSPGIHNHEGISRLLASWDPNPSCTGFFPHSYAGLPWALCVHNIMETLTESASTYTHEVLSGSRKTILRCPRCTAARHTAPQTTRTHTLVHSQSLLLGLLVALKHDLRRRLMMMILVQNSSLFFTYTQKIWSSFGTTCGSLRMTL